MQTPKVKLPPPLPTAPHSPITFSHTTPTASAFSSFSFAPSLAGFQPRSGGRRSLLGG